MNSIIALIPAGIAALLFFSGQRTARDVLNDLSERNTGQSPEHRNVRGKISRNIFKKHSTVSELPDHDNQSIHRFICISSFPLVFVVISAIQTAAGGDPVRNLIPAAVITAAVSYIICRIHLASCRVRLKRQIEFYLPVVMERLVMAVEAGFDIIPALGAVIQLDERPDPACPEAWRDPVTRMLEKVYKLSESGIPFEQSLDEVAQTSDSSALRHAFIHLGLAQKEGGEIMGPLRELSDATQLYYQETMELEIAAMPVRATMPLVLTFAGLIIFFISTPLVQISTITKGTVPGETSIHAAP